MSCDWNVEDVTAKKFKQSCQLKFRILISDETTIVLLDSLIPKAMGLNLNFCLRDFQQCDSEKVFQLD
jgi:hypothetical protein